MRRNREAGGPLESIASISQTFSSGMKKSDDLTIPHDPCSGLSIHRFLLYLPLRLYKHLRQRVLSSLRHLSNNPHDNDALSSPTLFLFMRQLFVYRQRRLQIMGRKNRLQRVQIGMRKATATTALDAVRSM